VLIGLLTLLALDIDPWLVQKAADAGVVESRMWASSRYLYFSLACVEFLVAGWVVGRLHRPYQGPVAVGFVALIALLQSPGLIWLVPNVFVHERFVPYFVEVLGMTVVAPMALLLGSAISARGLADYRTRQR
jgi:hypothetical protein